MRNKDRLVTKAIRALVRSVDSRNLLARARFDIIADIRQQTIAEMLIKHRELYAKRDNY